MFEVEINSWWKFICNSPIPKTKNTKNERSAVLLIPNLLI